MNKKIISFLLFVISISHFVNVLAVNHFVILPKKISYTCRCQSADKNALCRIVRDHVNLAPRPVKLHEGWVVQLVNCHQGQKYTLTAGSQLFAGTKIRALFSNLPSPLSVSGYVYHVVPNLPFTRENYSLTVVTNPAIKGIDLKRKDHGWQCGIGNRQTACRGKFHSARCFVGHACQFLYQQNIK